MLDMAGRALAQCSGLREVARAVPANRAERELCCLNPSLLLQKLLIQR